jgi:hypothetical protein
MALADPSRHLRFNLNPDDVMRDSDSPLNPGEPTGDDGQSEPLNARGPLRSRFPGELVLRDLYEGAPVTFTCLITARFAVLQIAERYAEGFVEKDWLEAEVDAAAAYIQPVRRTAVAEALRLRILLDRIRDDQPERVAHALLAMGTTALSQAHVYGAVACYRAAHELGRRIGKNALALSAASRLAELATILERPKLGRRWQRQCAALLEACH